MRHRAKGRQLSRTSSHKKATLNNMATSLFQHEGINTTVAKAKELRPLRMSKLDSSVSKKNVARHFPPRLRVLLISPR